MPKVDNDDKQMLVAELLSALARHIERLSALVDEERRHRHSQEVYDSYYRALAHIHRDLIDKGLDQSVIGPLRPPNRLLRSYTTMPLAQRMSRSISRLERIQRELSSFPEELLDERYR